MKKYVNQCIHTCDVQKTVLQVATLQNSHNDNVFFFSTPDCHACSQPERHKRVRLPPLDAFPHTTAKDLQYCCENSSKCAENALNVKFWVKTVLGFG